jgi:hypothetical protein
MLLIGPVGPVQWASTKGGIQNIIKFSDYRDFYVFLRIYAFAFSGKYETLHISGNGNIIVPTIMKKVAVR